MDFDFEKIFELVRSFDQDKQDCINFLTNLNPQGENEEEIVSFMLGIATCIATIERLDDSVNMSSQAITIMAEMISLMYSTPELEDFIQNQESENENIMRLITFMVISFLNK